MGMVASATDLSTNQKHGRMHRQHVSMLSMDHWLPLMTGQISDNSSKHVRTLQSLVLESLYSNDK